MAEILLKTGLNAKQTPVEMTMKNKAFGNIVDKGDNDCNRHFFLFPQFLALLFWNKKSRYCHDPGVISIGIGIGTTNFHPGHMLLLKIFTLNLLHIFAIKRTMYTIKGDNS